MTARGQDHVPTPETLSPERQHIRFLRSLAELDARLGKWRPDYGGLRAPEELRPADRSADGDLGGALERYVSSLAYFAAHPAALEQLGEPHRSDVAAALADDRVRPQWEAAARAGPHPAAGAPSRSRGGAAAPAGAQAPPRLGRRPALWMGGVALLVIVGVVVAAIVVGGSLGQRETPTAAGPTLATLPSSALAVGAPPDVIALARRCATFARGISGGALGVRSATSGPRPDPATGLSAPSITLTLTPDPPTHGPPFSVIVVILPFAATPPPPSTAPAIDRAGTTQLVGYWDGTRWHRALRTLDGSTWTTVTDLAASGVSVAGTGPAVTLFWQGLGSGAAYGEVVAGASGCSARDLSDSLVPTHPYGS